MAYMMMLVAEDLEQINAILRAWESIHIDDIVLLESTCFHRGAEDLPHIPMRFMFERPTQGQRQVSVTLLGVVRDEAMVQQCIVQAETVIGDFGVAENAMLVAWPLPIVRGFPRQALGRGEREE
jgi:hypothetical protein